MLLLRGASGLCSGGEHNDWNEGRLPPLYPAGISQFPRPKNLPHKNLSLEVRRQKSPKFESKPADRLFPLALRYRRRITISADHISSQPHRAGGRLLPSEAVLIPFVKRHPPVNERRRSFAQGAPGSHPNLQKLKFARRTEAAVQELPRLHAYCEVSDPNSTNVTAKFLRQDRFLPLRPGTSFSIVELPIRSITRVFNGGFPAMFQFADTVDRQQRVCGEHCLCRRMRRHRPGLATPGWQQPMEKFGVEHCEHRVSALDDTPCQELPPGITYSFGVGNHDQGPSG